LKSGKVIEIDNYNDVPDKKTYVCTVCHYVYDGDVPFEELPEDWTCPVCNQPKSVFLAE
jgi:rubredoxin